MPTISITINCESADEARKILNSLHPVGATSAPSDSSPSAESTAPAKASRPKKVEEKKEVPVENDNTVTADHPKRAELKTIAKEYAGKTDTASAQKAVKLFGENTSSVPDSQLGEAILHIKNLLKKLDLDNV